MADNRKSILMRAYLVYVMVLIFGLVILGKIIYLQFGQGDYWKTQAEDLALKYEVIAAKRGNIYGENNCLLATSMKIYDVGMDINPKVVPDSIFYSNLQELSKRMGALFSEPASLYYDKLYKARKRFTRDSTAYVQLRKDVTYAQLKIMETFPIFERGRYKGGLVADAREIREMPYNSLAKRTIGYVKLAYYDIGIDFSKTGIPEDKFSTASDTLAFCLFNLFHDGYKVKTYREWLDQSYKGEKVIRRRIDSRQLEILKTFPLIEDMQAKTGLSCVKVQQEYKIGLEGSFDKLLSGRDGTRLVQKMGAGAWKPVNDENLVEPLNGSDIYTSIDVNLQDVTENALRRSLDSARADWGCCILMETKTGFIKAISNLTRGKDGSYTEQFNYAVVRSMEPGSTFKLASVMAILEEGTYDTSTVVPTGTGRVGYREVPDAYPPGYGNISLAHAFEKSSNRGISFLTYTVFSKKLEKFKELLIQMGLRDPLGIELKGEPKPSLPVKLGDMETIPYGYVVQLTPLQMLAYYNAVANDGTLVRPRFVKAVGRAGEIIQETEVKVLKKKICSDNTLAKVRKLLEGVVERGTATNLHPAACKIAGKTGTAKIYTDSGYINRYVASFVGYFPADQPEYSCIVVIHGTSGSEYSGSQVSAPVFLEIADRVYATRLDIRAKEKKRRVENRVPLACTGYGEDLSTVYSLLNFKVVPENQTTHWLQSERKGLSVTFHPVSLQAGRMPDVRGMSARDAVWVLEGLGLKTKVTGVGIVKDQFPQAGTIYRKEQLISLKLSTQN